MGDLTATVAIGPMTLQDVEEVAALEQRCYSSPWSAATFRRELETNVRSTYLMMRCLAHSDAEAELVAGKLVGYGGYWLLDNEVHITTVAVHPDWRQRGLASRVLFALLAGARSAGGRSATLEVRESNVAAQRLYGSFGFVESGRRRNYYGVDRMAGTREDALLLELAGLDDGTVWRPLLSRFGDEPPLE